jgi:hypothetical protein
MKYACQSLHDVLEDIESSFNANSDRIKSVINKENEEDNVTEFNDTVEAICQDMDGITSMCLYQHQLIFIFSCVVYYCRKFASTSRACKRELGYISRY